MTEHDRGAYMPHGEAPLAFDARAPRSGRPMPMTLIASGGVLVLILGALFLAYRGGVRGAAGAAPLRHVGQPVGSIKVAAAPGAQAQDPDAHLDVDAAQNVPNATAQPTFAASPEQPHARPAPLRVASVEPAPSRLQVQSVATPPVRIEAPEAVAAPAGRTTVNPGAADQQGAAAALVARPASTEALRAPAPVKAAAPVVHPKPAPAKAAASEITVAELAPPKAVVPAKAVTATPKAPPAAKPKAVAASTPDAPPAGAASGAAAVQIGAFSSRELATKGYADVSGLMAGRMGGHGSHVEPVARDGKTMFRTTVTGFSDRAAAKTFCAALSAKGRACFVKAG